jgi:hypothetical protein
MTDDETEQTAELLLRIDRQALAWWWSSTTWTFRPQPWACEVTRAA